MVLGNSCSIYCILWVFISRFMLYFISWKETKNLIKNIKLINNKTMCTLCKLKHAYQLTFLDKIKTQSSKLLWSEAFAILLKIATEIQSKHERPIN